MRERGHRVAGELDLRGDEHVVGSEVHRAQVDDAFDLGAVGHGGANLLVELGRDGFTDQQALHLDREHHRDHAEQRADAEAAGGIPARVARELGDGDPDQRDPEADERAGVLEEDHRELGVLRGPDEVPPRPVALAHREGFATSGAE
jgi:hypothetical protein